MTRGLVHLYWGEGKGKTTAAMGLALRALGRGWRVSVLQFLKNGESGEVEALKRLGATVEAGKPGEGFASRMGREEQLQLRERQTALLEKMVKSDAKLLILDEACAACRLGLVDEEKLKAAILDRPAGREIVMTGREPAEWMLLAADYSSRICEEKHPYREGIGAREGIEY